MHLKQAYWNVRITTWTQSESVWSIKVKVTKSSSGGKCMDSSEEKSRPIPGEDFIVQYCFCMLFADHSSVLLIVELCLLGVQEALGAVCTELTETIWFLQLRLQCSAQISLPPWSGPFPFACSAATNSNRQLQRLVYIMSVSYLQCSPTSRANHWRIVGG